MSPLTRARDLGQVLARSSLYLLYPPTCALCEREICDLATTSHQFTCNACMEQIERVERPWCAQCGNPMEDARIDLCERCAHTEMGFSVVRSYGVYDGPLARLIQLYKYEREIALARLLAPMLAQSIEEERLFNHFDAITFVPMRSKRRHQRGFNQSAVLAKHLSQLTGRPVVKALKKTRDTRTQMELSGDARRANLTGAFAARMNVVPTKVLIIDDVYTTGSTLSECGSALRAAGAEFVLGLTVARAPLTDHTEEQYED